MNKLLRLLKHRTFDETDVRRVLDADAMKRIEARVAESERHHSGEIRVCVEPGLPLSYLWRNASARERAVSMFGKLRVWDTEANNGVLIYLLLAEHRIEVVADRGLNRHVTADQWQHLLDAMRANFMAGRFEDGIIDAITLVDRLLREHFPASRDLHNPNELPDHPVIA
jgi:uncharacterized membrane protein